MDLQLCDCNAYRCPSDSSVMTSVYWGALTLSRLVSIPLAMRFRPRTLLIANLVGCLIGLSLAVVGGGSAIGDLGGDGGAGCLSGIVFPSFVIICPEKRSLSPVNSPV